MINKIISLFVKTLHLIKTENLLQQLSQMGDQQQVL